jgi:hypothetical protein
VKALRTEVCCYYEVTPSPLSTLCSSRLLLLLHDSEITCSVYLISPASTAPPDFPRRKHPTTTTQDMTPRLLSSC